MAQYRMLVSMDNTAWLDARDTVVNTFYLDTDLDIPEGTDPQQLAEDAANMWVQHIDVPAGFNRVRVRAYNMSDPLPRQPVGNFARAVASGGAGGPREVALCLSYYAGSNVPRKRGRMYLGPFYEGEMKERPGQTVRDQLAALAEGISGLGGVNVQWVQYSPTTGNFSNVTDYWVDDEWDTVRSRGLKGTTRTLGTVNG